MLVHSDEEPEQLSGLLAGGKDQHWAKDPQTAGRAGEGDTGEQSATREKCGEWNREEGVSENRIQGGLEMRDALVA